MSPTDENGVSGKGWRRYSISLRPSDVAAIIDLANRILAESPELKKPENQASE